MLEVLAVGLATTGLAAVILILPPHRWLPFIVEFERWAVEGDGYLRSHMRLAVASFGAVLVLALVAAYGLYAVQRWRRSAEFRSSGNVLVYSLGARPKGTVPYVGVHLEDGSLVEGVLHSYSLREGSLSEQEIALQRPIRVTPAGGSKAVKRGDLVRLIVPGRLMAFVTVMHEVEIAEGGARSRVRKAWLGVGRPVRAIGARLRCRKTPETGE